MNQPPKHTSDDEWERAMRAALDQFLPEQPASPARPLPDPPADSNDEQASNGFLTGLDADIARSRPIVPAADSGHESSFDAVVAAFDALPATPAAPRRPSKAAVPPPPAFLEDADEAARPAPASPYRREGDDVWVAPQWVEEVDQADAAPAAALAQVVLPAAEAEPPAPVAAPQPTPTLEPPPAVTRVTPSPPVPSSAATRTLAPPAPVAPPPATAKVTLAPPVASPAAPRKLVPPSVAPPLAIAERVAAPPVAQPAASSVAVITPASAVAEIPLSGPARPAHRDDGPAPRPTKAIDQPAPGKREVASGPAAWRELEAEPESDLAGERRWTAGLMLGRWESVRDAARARAARVTRRQVAIIALSIIGLSELAWITWRLAGPASTIAESTTPPQPSPAATSSSSPSAVTPAPITKPATTSASDATVASGRGEGALPPSSSVGRSAAPAGGGAAKPAPAVPAPAPAAAAARERPYGWVTVNSAAPVDVLLGGRRIGSSASGRVRLNAGRHEIEAVNQALGLRARRTVNIVAGQTAALMIDVPPGTVNINALPWASVSIDGTVVGDTPLANLRLSAGRHELLFQHPELGERRLSVTVPSGAPLRVSTDLRKQ